MSDFFDEVLCVPHRIANYGILSSVEDFVIALSSYVIRVLKVSGEPLIYDSGSDIMSAELINGATV
jgi:hypothetical protein